MKSHFRTYLLSIKMVNYSKTYFFFKILCKSAAAIIFTIFIIVVSWTTLFTNELSYHQVDDWTKVAISILLILAAGLMGIVIGIALSEAYTKYSSFLLREKDSLKEERRIVDKKLYRISPFDETETKEEREGLGYRKEKLDFKINWILNILKTT